MTGGLMSAAGFALAWVLLRLSRRWDLTTR